MKKTLALLLAFVVILFSIVAVSAESADILEPHNQVIWNFKNYYSEKTDGEKPKYVECYKLDYSTDSDEEYYVVYFVSENAGSELHIDYFGDNEFYVQSTGKNKVFSTGICVFKGYVYDKSCMNNFYSLEEIAKTDPEIISCIEEKLGSYRIGAIKGDECYKPLVDELDALCNKTVSRFGICSGDYYHNPGSVYLYINEEDTIKIAMDEAVELIEKTNYNYIHYVFDSNGVTQQEIMSAYYKLESAMESATVKKYEVEFLYDFCKDENNKNGYYPKELWEDFGESLKDAQMLLTKESVENDECNKVYWNLLYNYNRLCCVNTLMYDVNFDGSVDVMDATQYQRVRAGILSMNTSIEFITNFDPFAATTIQRRLAGYDLDKQIYLQSVLDTMVENQEILNIESDKFRFSAWKLNMMYSNHRCAGRC